MRRKHRQNAPAHRAAEPLSLAGVVTALQRDRKLTGTRRRDLVSAVKRVAALLGNEPSAVPLDMAAISAPLAAVNPVAVGITSKRLANIRSDFLAAVKATGLIPVKPGGKPVLSPPGLICSGDFRADEPTSGSPAWRAMQAPADSRPRTSMIRDCRTHRSGS
jgi:hypothetical protein